MASGIDPLVFLFLACALMKEIGVFKKIIKKSIILKDQGEKLTPGLGSLVEGSTSLSRQKWGENPAEFVHR